LPIGGRTRSETRHEGPAGVRTHRAGSSVFQGGASVFAVVPAGQNFRPLIRSGGGRIPASVQRSTVRTLTRCRSATTRVGSSEVASRSAAGSRFLRDMEDWLRDLVATSRKVRGVRVTGKGTKSRRICTPDRTGGDHACHRQRAGNQHPGVHGREHVDTAVVVTVGAMPFSGSWFFPGPPLAFKKLRQRFG